MEEEIEEKLEEIYTPYVKVKFREFGVYDVYLTLKGGNVIAIVFQYNAHSTFEANINNISSRIDRELVNLYKKGKGNDIY